MNNKKRIRSATIASVTSICLATCGISFAVNATAKAKPKLNCTKLTLKIGQAKKLTVKNTKKKITWKTSNKKIVTVSAKGLVKAKKTGSAKITAKTGGKSLTCKITVKKKTGAVQTPVPSQNPTVVPTPVPTVAPTVAPTTVPTPSPATTPEVTASPSPTPVTSPTPVPGTDWEFDKQCGSKEVFDMYFDADLDKYQAAKTGVEYGSFEKISYPSKVIGEDREAYVYTPAGYSTDKKYPVLYLLHGIGCDGKQWASKQVANIISNMIANNEVVPFVAVSPSIIPPVADRTTQTFSPANIKAFADFKDEFVTDLEPYIQQNYSVSTDRKDTGVAGLSMGGMEALSVGFSCLDHFNYIGSFSAAPSLDTSLLTLEGSEYTPDLVMLSCGDKDTTVRDNPYNYHMTLKNNNVDHIWFQFPDGSHSTNVWNNGLINFLKRSYK